MSRHWSSRAARVAGLRWLTVVLALTGLGILHGAHCADDMPIVVVAMAATNADGPSPVVDTGPPASAALAASPARGGHNHTDPSPGAAAGACLFLVTGVVGVAVSLTDALRHRSHRPVSGEDPPPAEDGRRPAGITLTALGVLRI